MGDQFDQRRADIHAFERRLKEILRDNQPSQQRWRFWLILFIVMTAIGARFLYMDMKQFKKRSKLEHLKNNYFFSFSAFVLLILLVVYRAHVRAFTRYILAERTRLVLSNFALTCDDDGNLEHWPENKCPVSVEEDCFLCDKDDEDDSLCLSEDEEKDDPYLHYYNN